VEPPGQFFDGHKFGRAHLSSPFLETLGIDLDAACAVFFSGGVFFIFILSSRLIH
jgi:hypothetical protein